MDMLLSSCIVDHFIKQLVYSKQFVYSKQLVHNKLTDMNRMRICHCHV